MVRQAERQAVVPAQEEPRPLPGDQRVVADAVGQQVGLQLRGLLRGQGGQEGGELGVNLRTRPAASGMIRTTGISSLAICR